MYVFMQLCQYTMLRFSQSTLYMKNCNLTTPLFSHLFLPPLPHGYTPPISCNLSGTCHS